MKKRKPAHLIWMISILLISAGIFIPSLSGAGSLEPSAAPASTMKTLDEVEPRIAIPGSGTAVDVYTISQSGSYYLAGNRVCSGTGIQVDADNVTIDLMGYALIGPGTETTNGITMSGRINVEIRNGTVRDFYNGIYESGSSGGGHRIISIRSISNGKNAIYIYNKSALVKGCTIYENGTNCSTEVCGIYTRWGSTVINNLVYENGNYCDSAVYGIYTSIGSTVTNNTVSQNGFSAAGTVYGIYPGNNSTVTNNTSSSNGGNCSNPVYGIRCGAGCTVINNTANGNGGAGAGTAYGIYLVGNNLVDRNTAYLNDDINMDTCATCTFGTNHAP